MATKLVTSDDGWLVRLADGEYQLSLAELSEWILSGLVCATHDVRPPTTKRWEHAENCIELKPYFAEKYRADAQARWDAEAPARATAAESMARTKENFSRVGCSMGVFGLLVLFTGTEFGVVFGIGLGAVGFILYYIGKSLEQPQNR